MRTSIRNLTIYFNQNYTQKVQRAHAVYLWYIIFDHFLQCKHSIYESSKWFREYSGKVAKEKQILNPPEIRNINFNISDRELPSSQGGHNQLASRCLIQLAKIEFLWLSHWFTSIAKIGLKLIDSLNHFKLVLRSFVGGNRAGDRLIGHNRLKSQSHMVWITMYTKFELRS